MSARVHTRMALAGAVVLVVTACTARAQTTPANPPKPVAVVNGEPISMAQVEAYVAMLRGGPVTQAVPEAKQRESRYLAIGLLVDEALFRQALRRMPAPDPAEVAKRLGELEDMMKKNGSSLADLCKETGQTQVQMQAQVISLIQWGEYCNKNVTEEQLKKYYEDSKPFWDRIEVRCSHIALRVAPNASESEKQAAYKKLSGIYQEIMAGKLDFAAAARQYSESPTKDQGGDIGYITRKGMVDDAFARAVFDPRLQIGQITGLVQNDFGYHIIKITDRQQKGPATTFDDKAVKAAVRGYYCEEMRMMMIDAERKNAKVEINLP